MPRTVDVAAALRLTRPANALVSATAAILGALLVADAVTLPWPRVLAAAVAAFAFAAAGNVRNDIGDVEVDRVAHPRRPLVTGAVPLAAARTLAIALYVAAIVAGAFVSLAGLALVVLAVPLMETYERWGKAAGFPGNLMIGALTGAPFVLGAVAAGRVGPAVLALALLAALATVGREVLKDVEDARADALRRVTLPMRIGARRAALVAGAFLAGAAALSPLPWMLETVLGWAYLPAVGVADACFLAAAVAGARAPGRGQRLAKAGMIVALAALLVGRAQTGGVGF